MLRDSPETYPFWTEHAEDLGPTRIGLSEAFLECLAEDLVGLEFLVQRGHLAKGETLAQLHTGTRTVDLRVPFAMEVLSVNDKAAEDARLVSESPYFEGWLAEVRIAKT